MSGGVLSHAPLDGCRIALIDDNDDFAMTMAELLELFGHEVSRAADGVSGVVLVEQVLPDVVLCDIGLPGLDGYAVAQQLRQNPALCRCRLIAITGYADEASRKRAQESGFDVHLAKPVALEQLLLLLRPPP